MANPFVKGWKYLMASFGAQIDERVTLEYAAIPYVAERRAFLAEACAGDAELRRRLPPVAPRPPRRPTRARRQPRPPRGARRRPRPGPRTTRSSRWW